MPTTAPPPPATIPVAPSKSLPRKDQLPFGSPTQKFLDQAKERLELEKRMVKRQSIPERQYVCAFVPVFRDRANVLLIRKLNPDWQKGKLNGIGGKIEEADANHPEYSPQIVAMCREWQEETGLGSVPALWQEIVYLWGQDKDGNFWGVHFFTYDGVFDIEWMIANRKHNDVGERFEIIDSWTLAGRIDTIPNLKWLVPFCFYHGKLDLPIKINDTENVND